jgi:energy-coupling factor transport system ATP-binding protein
VALVLDSIGYSYGAGTSFAAAALEGVSLSVAPGELVMVLGATGSGKSTLLRVSAGLLLASEGTASIDGEPLTRLAARGTVCLVFQDAESQLFAETIAQDVAFGPSNLGVSDDEARAQAAEALSSVGLDPAIYGARSPFHLSGGEARRAAIAGVLAMRPRYLLLDEPTAGLDASGRAAVRAIVRSQRERCGVVIVSHTAEEFLGEADRVVMLAGGREVFSADAESLMQRPEAFAEVGLAAPDVLKLQLAARSRGIDTGPFTLDPVRAAEAIARAGGWS